MVEPLHCLFWYWFPPKSCKIYRELFSVLCRRQWFITMQERKAFGLHSWSSTQIYERMPSITRSVTFVRTNVLSWVISEEGSPWNLKSCLLNRQLCLCRQWITRRGDSGTLVKLLERLFWRTWASIYLNRLKRHSSDGLGSKQTPDVFFSLLLPVI